VIRVLFVDDHPSVRAGLQAVLRLEPGLVPVGEAVTAAAGVEAARTLEPDVVVADYHLPDEDGLVMCTRLKAERPSARVLIFSAYAGASLTLPALVAGADGVLDKVAAGTDLFEAIRLVARGQRMFPPITAEQQRNAARRLTNHEVPVFSMLLNGVTHDAIASTLGIDVNEVHSRVHSILDRLSVRTATATRLNGSLRQE
jgi:DNA-binding NarL/FixJ family response regulator